MLLTENNNVQSSGYRLENIVRYPLTVFYPNTPSLRDFNETVEKKTLQDSTAGTVTPANPHAVGKQGSSQRLDQERIIVLVIQLSTK